MQGWCPVVSAHTLEKKMQRGGPHETSHTQYSQRDAITLCVMTDKGSTDWKTKCHHIAVYKLTSVKFVKSITFPNYMVLTCARKIIQWWYMSWHAHKSDFTFCQGSRFDMASTHRQSFSQWHRIAISRPWQCKNACTGVEARPGAFNMDWHRSHGRQYYCREEKKASVWESFDKLYKLIPIKIV